MMQSQKIHSHMVQNTYQKQYVSLQPTFSTFQNSPTKENDKIYDYVSEDSDFVKRQIFKKSFNIYLRKATLKKRLGCFNLALRDQQQ